MKFEFDIEVVHLILEDEEVGVDEGLVRLVQNLLVHVINLLLHPRHG